MENRKLNQIVFVIMDNYENKIVGVYNDYTEAVQVAEAAEKDYYEDDFITITPVLVDTVNIVPDSRKLYWNEQGVVDALRDELDLAMPYVEDEEEDEEEDNDPIADMLYDLDDRRTAISFEDACFLMDMIKETGIERGLSEDEAIKAAQTIFIQIGKDYGIDVVEEEEGDEEEEDDEDEDEEEADPIAKMLFTYDGKVTISQKDAMEIVRQMTEMIEEQGKGLTGEQKTKWLRDALTALAEDYGIEYVLNI